MSNATNRLIKLVWKRTSVSFCVLNFVNLVGLIRWRPCTSLNNYWKNNEILFLKIKDSYAQLQNFRTIFSDIFVKTADDVRINIDSAVYFHEFFQRMKKYRKLLQKLVRYGQYWFFWLVLWILAANDAKKSRF